MFALALVAMGAPAVGSPAGAAPDPSSVSVQSITYGGTGCPQGTANPAISADGTQFAVVLDQLLARTGPGVPGIESRRLCQLSVNLHMPQALLSALTVDLVIPGHGSLPAGTTASVKSTAYLGGAGPSTSPAQLSADSVDGLVGAIALVAPPC